MLVHLQQLLCNVSLCKDEADEWVWKEDPSACFSVKSAYCFLQNQHLVVNSVELRQQVFKKFWVCKVPSKVLAFSWRLLLDRLPTQAQLAHRNIIDIQQGTSCVFCFNNQETAEHLFFSCPFSYLVWCCIYSWLGISVVLHQAGCEHYIQHGNLIRGEAFSKSKYLFWHAVNWSFG